MKRPHIVNLELEDLQDNCTEVPKTIKYIAALEKENQQLQMQLQISQNQVNILKRYRSTMRQRLGL